ncbi:MAG TPA: hypothetical protein VFD33_04715 [Bacillota bacterium]|nr:hypothetical protein [Bacillota bacterium]
MISGQLILGIGIGLVIASILLLPFKSKKPSPMEIEGMAREMGMVYEDEIKAISDVEKGENRE